jgi:dihydrodipicolinate synthase/N-acetylneuraminate lyase
MSRIGRKPIDIPDGVEVDVKPGAVTVKGPKGELVQQVDPKLIVSGIGEQPAIIHLRDFGCGGFTSGCVCVAPGVSRRMHQAIKAGDWTTAESIRATFRPLEDLRNHINPIRVLHEAVALAGIAETGAIEPLLSPLSEADRASVGLAARALLAA